MSLILIAESDDKKLILYIVKIKTIE